MNVFISHTRTPFTQYLHSCLSHDTELLEAHNIELLNNDHDLKTNSISADVIIVDLHANRSEIVGLLKLIRRDKSKDRVVICISSIETWARSEFHSEDKVFHEEDYLQREPSPEFMEYKQMENLILNAASSYLKTFVIAAGTLYGFGEYQLHPLFKDAWLCECSDITCVGNGSNSLATIHIKDLMTFCLAILDDASNLDSQYFFGVDESSHTLDEIARSVVSILCNGSSIKWGVHNDEYSPSVLQDLHIHANGMISQINMDWHCKDGIVANIDTICREFVVARKLSPLRIVMHGPQSNQFACKMADKFHLRCIKVDDYIDNIDNIEKVVAMLKDILMSSVCRKKGFILDGYPRTTIEANALFDDPNFIPHFVFKMLPQQVFNSGLTSVFPNCISEDDTDSLTIDGCEVLEVMVDDPAAFQIMSLVISPSRFFNYHPVIEEPFFVNDTRLVTESSEPLDQGEIDKDIDPSLLDALTRRSIVLKQTASIPLRTYIVENAVIPIRDGLSEMCQVDPSDPVDYLSEYLFKCANVAK